MKTTFFSCIFFNQEKRIKIETILDLRQDFLDSVFMMENTPKEYFSNLFQMAGFELISCTRTNFNGEVKFKTDGKIELELTVDEKVVKI
jgi:hypothetical protein